MKPARKNPPLSEAQLEIMQEVWNRGEATVTQVWEALAQRRTVARNTIHTLMERLVKKGWLQRRIEGPSHYFAAKTSRTNTMKRLLNRLVDTVFCGSAEELILTLLKGRALTSQEAERIQSLIAQSKKEDS